MAKTLQKKGQQGQTEVKLLLPFFLADLENQLSYSWAFPQNGHHDDFHVKKGDHTLANT